MANTLKIIKEGTNKFWHIHNGITAAKFILSDFSATLDGHKFNIVQNDGAVRFTYLVENITIKDNTGAGTDENYVSPLLFWNRLIALQYTPFFNVSAVGISGDEYDAIHGASSPSASNPFATVNDLVAGATIPFATFQFVRKGYENSGAIGEAGDIYQGWVSDGVFCPFAVYDGSGPFDDSASFNIVNVIEI